jgi:hypothetical protein
VFKSDGYLKVPEDKSRPQTPKSAGPSSASVPPSHTLDGERVKNIAPTATPGPKLPSLLEIAEAAIATAKGPGPSHKGEAAKKATPSADHRPKRPTLLELGEAAIGTAQTSSTRIPEPPPRNPAREAANTASSSAAGHGPKRPTPAEPAQVATGVGIPPSDAGSFPPPQLSSPHGLDGGEGLENVAGGPADGDGPPGSGTGTSNPRRPSLIPRTPSERASSEVSRTFIMAGGLPGETGRPGAPAAAESSAAEASGAPRRKSRYVHFM